MPVSQNFTIATYQSADSDPNFDKLELSLMFLYHMTLCDHESEDAIYKTVDKVDSRPFVVTIGLSLGPVPVPDQMGKELSGVPFGPDGINKVFS